MTTLNSDDNFCSRIVFDQNFDTRKDIYVSFQSPKIPRLITESGDFFLLTEDGDVLIVDTNTCVSLFLIDSDENVDTDKNKGTPGFGCGLLSPSSTLKENMSGHFISICLDFVGGYGLKDVFKDSGDRGNTELIPNSITARVSSTNSQYDFLSTVAIPNFSILTSNFRSFRFVFKEHMNKIRVDLKTDDEEIFKTVFEAETNVDLLNIPRQVKVGLAASGNEPFSIGGITYSGEIFDIYGVNPVSRLFSPPSPPSPTPPSPTPPLPTPSSETILVDSDNNEIILDDGDNIEIVE